MIRDRETAAHAAALTTADQMVAAAWTAPKASGHDTIRTLVIAEDDLLTLADAIEAEGREGGEAFFLRDADCVRASHCVVLIGAIQERHGLQNCSLCGFADCGSSAKAGAKCVMPLTDLGIAIGSAVSLATDARLDCRVMYSVGKGALRLGLLGEEVTICYGLPLATASKNPFFDRNPGAVMKD